MTVPANSNALLLRSAAPATYQVSRSLRFNSADTTYLERTPASAGNRKTWTWSGWVKRSSGDQFNYLFDAVTTDPSTGENRISFEDNKIKWYSNSTTDTVETVAVFRDFSAWYHIVFAYNSTEATSSNRIKVYVNGVQQTLTGTYPALNAEPHINNTRVHNIGRSAAYGRYFNGYMADIWFLDGIAATPSDFAETDATTGQWIPKTYSGSKGSNGFHLEFADNSNNTASTLGKDTSGNSNNWTPNNLVANSTPNYASGLFQNLSGTGSISNPDQAFNGNTGNGFALNEPFNGGTSTAGFTFSPVLTGTTIEAHFTTGNTFYYNASWAVDTGSGYGSENTIGNFFDGWVNLGVTTLKGIRLRNQWLAVTANAVRLNAIRINGTIIISNLSGDSLVDTPTSYGTGNSGGDVRGNYCTLNPLLTGNGSYSNGNLDSTFSSGSSIGYDQRQWGTIGVSSGKWYFEYVQTSGNSQGVGIKSTIKADNLNNYAYVAGGLKLNASGSTSSYGAAFAINDVIGVAFDLDGGTITFYLNGTSQGQAFSGIPSGTYFPFLIGWSGGDATQSVNFGQRAWAYTPPANHKALCDTNLPSPSVAKPNTVMDVALYTGNGSSSRAITGLNFSPDFVWTKSRNQAYSHYLFDVVRGANKALFSDTADSEQTYTSYLLSFDSAGFTVGNGSQINANGDTYVGWTWDAGSSNATNTSGSITSTCRTNISAGFSVITWTGTTANATVGHGLGVAPQFILFKTRGNAYNWRVYHASLGNTKALILNSTATPATNISYFNNTSPTSTVINLGTSDETNDTSMVAYAWAPVAGYSAFGSFTGNGSTDGPFVYTGFRPRWILIKTTANISGNWYILDTARDAYNVMPLDLYANDSAAESTVTTNQLDALSNGFKLRGAGGGMNGSGHTLIYAAFAENPFQYARAR